MSIATGRVKWFNDKRGYGFITQENGDDVFIHYSEITGEGYKTLKEGALVEFELANGEKGLQAHKLGVVGEAVAEETEETVAEESEEALEEETEETVVEKIPVEEALVEE